MTVASRQKTTGDRPLTALSKRGYLLTGWLTLSIIGGILYIIFLVISGMAFSGGGLLAVTLQILALSSMNGIWKIQKWGYYFLAFLYIAAIIPISFSGRYAIITGGFEIASDLFQLIVLSLIVLPCWKYLD